MICRLGTFFQRESRWKAHHISNNFTDLITLGKSADREAEARESKQLNVPLRLYLVCTILSVQENKNKKVCFNSAQLQRWKYTAATFTKCNRTNWL